MKLDYLEFKNKLIQLLETNQFRQSERPEASVLIPIFQKNNEPWFILTKRSATLQKHSGQVSFPGGRVDESDKDKVTTALRETFEELNLAKENIRILGSWHDFWTPYFQHVATILGEVLDLSGIKQEPAEIERIIYLPVSDFLNPNVHTTELRTHNGTVYEVHHFHLAGEDIWGATAGVIFFLLKELGLIDKDNKHLPEKGGLT